ncbi:MAG TPA: hypothetical protein VF335_00595, partial [Chitinivibrionales bacterium]
PLYLPESYVEILCLFPLNTKHALGFDEEPQDRDAERLEGFAVHTNCGMDKKPEGLYACEITVMRKVLMHDLGLK